MERNRAGDIRIIERIEREREQESELVVVGEQKQKRMLDPLELQLKMVKPRDVGAKIRT